MLQDPENEKQWEATGKFIAKRNLLASIPNLTCGFGVWLVWSGTYSRHHHLIQFRVFRWFRSVSNLFLQLILSSASKIIVIATKIQKMHDADPNVYSFPDWDSPTGKEVSCQ